MANRTNEPACAFCGESHVENASTWQQWQCAACGKWNDKPAGEPSRPVDQARDALAHLIAARELLKGVGAARTVERIRSAISSAKGAVRHAEHRCVES